jgi:hypothetical protein
MSNALLAGLVAGLLAGGVLYWRRAWRSAAGPGDAPPFAATGPRARAARQAGAQAGQDGPAPAATGRFRAVVIRPGRDCCEAVRALAGRPALTDEAPALPLAGCDRARCHCRFQRLADRRGGDERRFSFGSLQTVSARREQRAARDRRRD